jgi:hypothetical protein
MTDSGGEEFGITRQKAIDALCEHFANDALSVDDFEARVDMAHKAESADQLRELLKDLPRGDLPIPRKEMPDALAPRVEASVPASRVKENGFMVALLGGAERKGRWIPARRTFGVALMGGFSLDFREALLPPGPTEVWLFNVMGGAEIVVPPGLSVECDGMAVLGGFDYHDDAPVNLDPDTPILRIRGFALMGGVEVTVRNPGETARDAKKRRREERKARRLAKKERKRLEKGK